MKRFIALISISFSLNALATDLAQKHAAFCDSPEALELKGVGGSCQVIISLQPEIGEMKGVCVGTVMRQIPCRLTYNANSSGAEMQLVCGPDPLKPLLDQTIMASAESYNVSAIISNQENRMSVLNDKADYTFFESRLLGVTLSKVENITSASITLSLQSGDTELTEVECF